jgi:mannitol-1-phosphate 5-dehydrogenase
MDLAMMKALMFGAGNIGRGFLGQLFSESGYEVVFVDIDARIIAALNEQGSYRIRLVDNDQVEDVRVGPVRALHVENTEAVAEQVAVADIAATAVGVRALPDLASHIAAGIARRAAQGVHDPLSIIVCENLKGAAEVLRRMVGEHVPSSLQSFFHSYIGFVDTVIERIVPRLAPETRADDPTFVIAEPYRELPVDRRGFLGPIPEIAGMHVTDGFEAYTARKLYINNCGHAVLAYLGYLWGYSMGFEALENPTIRAMFDGAVSESKASIVAAHGVEAAWLDRHIAGLVHRFANRALGDEILRLARDPIRKLAPQDRLVGPARLAERAGVVPDCLAWSIAAGYCFDDDRDPIAGRLQQRIASEGLDAVLADISDIRAEEPLGVLVRERYERLQCQDALAQIAGEIHARRT